MPDSECFEDLLRGLADSDSARRKHSEQVYSGVPESHKLSFLGRIISNQHLPESERVFAAVLLRRLIISHWAELQAELRPEELLMSCNELLNMLKNSVGYVSDIRDKLCHVVSALGKAYLNEESKVNQWQQFVQFIFESLKASQAEMRECSLKILASAPDVLGEVNGRTAYLEQLYPCLMDCFNIKIKSDVFCVSLVAAVSGIINTNSSNKECVKQLSAFAVPLTETLRCVASDSCKEEICQSLIEIAEAAPLCLRPSIQQLLQICVELMANSDHNESELGFSALELAVSMIENAPTMVKKRAASCIKPIVLRILHYMTLLDDDEEWYTTCSNEKDSDEPDAIAEAAIDRVSNSLGGKVLLPILMEQMTAMLNKQEWQSRHAALIALSCAAEGCRTQLMHDLNRIVIGIIGYMDDIHPRVRHAACHAIGQMSTDFEPDFQKKFHGQVIPALCRLLIDFTQIRVQAHAACAMINFYENCPQEILAEYLKLITEHMEAVLSRYLAEGLPDECKLFVVENVIVALSSVAESSQNSFIDYYDKFMPCLKFIITQATGRENLRMLRGKAIECVSLTGMAVGKQKFCADAPEIMQILLSAQTGDIILADDDPQLSYMMAAWARICRILGPDFKPYLPHVMEPVLKAAAMRIEVALFNDEDRAAIENNSEWESVSVRDQTVGIRTAGLEDKNTACSMLVCYAKELKHNFIEYVDRTAEVLVPLLKFPFHDDVRWSAAEAMPYLLDCIKPKGDAAVLNLWNVIFEKLLGALELDNDDAILTQLLETLGSCIETVGLASMNPEKYAQLTMKLQERLKVHFENLEEEFENRKDEDYETISDCSEEDEDESCLSGIATVIHSLFVIYKSDYLPYFEALIEPIMKLSVQSPAIPWTNRQTALCIWDDVIEYTGANCISYQKFFLPLLSVGITDNSKEIRQAALYGVGQLAQQTGATFLEFYQGILPNIVQIINHPEARTEDFIIATENGIAAVGRILKYCPQIANHSELVKCWIDWLPIWEDGAEVPDVMSYLLELIGQNHQSVMGPNSSNLPRLVAVVAEVFARSVIEVHSEVGLKLVHFLKQVHANPSVNSCLATLTLEQQKAVQEVISVQC